MRTHSESEIHMDDLRSATPFKTRRQRRIDRRRRQIMKAATRVITEHGYANATTKAIADEADISEGTLYNYFDSKRAILLGIIGQYQQEADALLDRVELADGATDPVAVIEWLLGLLLARLPFTRVLLAEPWAHDEQVRAHAAERVAAIQARVQTFIVAQIDRGVFRPVDPELATSIVMGMCLAPVLPVLRGDAPPPSPEDVHRMAVATVDLMMRGLEAR